MSVRNDTATTTCGQCDTAFTAVGRQTWCTDACRQAAWRRRRAAPAPAPPPLTAKTNTIYECPECETRYLGTQRCNECNTWCRRLGPGGPCPHCDEPVTITDLTTNNPDPSTSR